MRQHFPPIEVIMAAMFAWALLCIPATTVWHWWPVEDGFVAMGSGMAAVLLLGLGVLRLLRGR